MLNLSLLTSDMWAVLIRIFAYHQKVFDHFSNILHAFIYISNWRNLMSPQVDWMYFVAFAGVAIGLIIYSR